MEKKRSRRHSKPRARTQDIVGQGTERPITPKWRRHYERLVSLRDHILREQTQLAQDAIEEQPTFSTHVADAGTDSFDRDLALSMLSSEQDALYEIEEAIDRIRNGTYGKCELTGKPIEAGRLEAIPWTRFSAAAEKELERDGVVKHTQLNRRDAVAKEDTSRQTQEGESA